MEPYCFEAPPSWLDALLMRCMGRALCEHAEQKERRKVAFDTYVLPAVNALLDDLDACDARVAFRETIDDYHGGW
jgi:hypothetical protein